MWGILPNGPPHVHFFGFNSHRLCMAQASHLPALCALDAHFWRAQTEVSFAGDFYLTVKVALRHESVDLEEDRKGLGPVPNGTLIARCLPPSPHT